MEISLASGLLVVCAGAFTAAAAVWDWRFWRIPNKLTLPAFAAGLIYQFAFHGLAGLADAGLGFLVGFGVLFVLWMVGGGGGGDVKLMGALSVWLGFHLTLLVLVMSTLLVVCGFGAVLFWNLLTRRGGAQPIPPDASAAPAANGSALESIEEQKRRRVMGFAVPVAAATWLVLLYKLPTLP